MSETPMVLEVNCSTGEQIMREMTAEELAQREADAAAAEAERVAREAAEAERLAALESAREELLAAGISEAAVDAIMSARQ